MAAYEVKVSGIEKFDGTDFGYWRIQIEAYIYGKKLNLPLLGKRPERVDEAEWTLLDRQVMGIIRLNLSRSVAHIIVKKRMIADLRHLIRPAGGAVIRVSSVGYEVFLLLLQFLYSGQVSIQLQKHEPRPNCGDHGCWHTHCTAAVDLALDTLAAARSFGIDQLAFLTQKQLEIMVEKSSIEDVMKVLMAARKQEMHQLWSTCSHLVANSGLPPESLAKHLPLDIVAKLEDLRRLPFSSSHIPSTCPDHHHHKIYRMRRALHSSDVELVKLMVMGEGLNLDDALALHYAVEHCNREVVKALLELGTADVNFPAGPNGRTPLHIAARLVSPDMVAVLLDHHADPNARTLDGVTPLDILRSLTSDFLFKGALPGIDIAHFEPNKLRLCLELVQSAVIVASREEAASVYLNLGVAATVPAEMGYKVDHSGDQLDGRSRRSTTIQGGGGITRPTSCFPSSIIYSPHHEFP
ncbi:BTB/POZ domain and ankyrin repeat-containing protein NPR5-like [Phalaenopsis equestris]|uniref:BTB/POZ domain and ankyrin repeat-containing protein NPR5-like n=1 Tax=Phalaenopsis equestris TaxID=78828 RepID=UPI0009E5D773|nr:BTB/POZ domain and ankyrin repeat-containing protein NPR5-like [Phalaenopsis equestris]